MVLRRAHKSTERKPNRKCEAKEAEFGLCKVAHTPIAQVALREHEKSAVLVGLILSVFQRSSPERVEPFALREFRNPPPSVYGSLRPVLAEIDDSEQLVASLDVYFEDMARALPFVQEVTHDMPNGWSNTWLFEATLALKETAASALAVVEACRAKAGGEAVTGGNYPTPELSKLMNEVIAGRAPCWSEGQLRIPEWHCSRASTKYVFNEEVTFTWGGRRYVSVATEISRHGMTIKGHFPLKTSDRVSVELPSGRLLAGNISSAGLRSFALSFESPLAFYDPLLPA